MTHPYAGLSVKRGPIVAGFRIATWLDVLLLPHAIVGSIIRDIIDPIPNHREERHRKPSKVRRVTKGMGRMAKRGHAHVPLKKKRRKRVIRIA